MVAVTTEGLRPDGSDAASIPDVAWAIAAGTVNAITAQYDEPNTSLADGLILGIRALGANTTTTPSFAPDGLTAHTIVKAGGVALAPGDIPGALAEVLMRYNLANTRWELLNPYTSPLAGRNWAAAAGTVDVITASYTPAIASLTDGLILGIRAAGANLTTTPTFSPDSLTARTIVKVGGTALLAGDIPAANAEMLLRYNLANTRWELLNPAVGPAITAATVTPISLKALAAVDNGSNVNTAQPWFPTAGGITLAVGTYFVDAQLWLSRAAGTTSHTTSVLFGGTATASIGALAMAMTGDANTLVAMNGVWLDVLTAVVVKAASTSATEQIVVRIRGILRVTVAGTFIPQFQYSVAPGGAPTIKTNSYFNLEMLSSSASFASQGTWA